MPNMKFSKLLILTVVVSLFSCKTNVFTGKKTLNFMSNSQLFPMAFGQYGEFLNTNKVITGTADSEMITRTGTKIKL